MWPLFTADHSTPKTMHTLSDLEAGTLCGGIGFAMPTIQVSPNIIVNTIPQINAGSALALFGGDASVEQGNGSLLWNTLIASLFNIRR
jgi:hypothetical protein